MSILALVLVSFLAQPPLVPSCPKQQPAHLFPAQRLDDGWLHSPARPQANPHSALNDGWLYRSTRWDDAGVQPPLNDGWLHQPDPHQKAPVICQDREPAWGMRITRPLPKLEPKPDGPQAAPRP